jgi:hypothetical protein
VQAVRDGDARIVAGGSTRQHEVVMTRIDGTFAVTRMGGEDELADVGVRITHAYGGQRFDGGIAGEGSVDWLMCYGPDKTAELVGVQRIDGTIDGRRGSLVFTSRGRHDGTRSMGDWQVVEGSGTGELAGARGSGSWQAGPGPQATYELDLEID